MKPRPFRMHLLLASLAFCAGAGAMGCASMGGGMRPSRPLRPFFDAEVLTGIGDRGQSVATLSVSIPYRNLIFFRKETGYESSYHIRAVQLDPRGARALREWTGTVRVQTYGQTRTTDVARTTVSLDLTKLEAGKNEEAPRLEVSVAIDGSSRKAKRELPLKLSHIEPGSLALGELALYRQRDPFTAMPTEVETMGRALPDPELFRRQEDDRFDLATGEPWLFVRIFDLRGRSDVDSFEVDISSLPAGTDSARYHVRMPVDRQGYVTSLLLRLPASAFAFGLNDVEVHLAEAKPASIDLHNGGLDLSDDASWRANLLPLRDIATEAQYERLQKAKVSDRDRLWWEFWDPLDPDPSTPENERLIEHFRRVRYARAHLVDGFSDGALSDRGRLFIRLGPPDNIDESNSRMDSFASYQIWRYDDEGMVYYFRDATGSGHFRLVWWEEI